MSWPAGQFLLLYFAVLSDEAYRLGDNQNGGAGVLVSGYWREASVWVQVECSGERCVHCHFAARLCYLPCPTFAVRVQPHAFSARIG